MSTKQAHQFYEQIEQYIQEDIYEFVEDDEQESPCGGNCSHCSGCEE